jgi:hypothetical protein
MIATLLMLHYLAAALAAVGGSLSCCYPFNSDIMPLSITSAHLSLLVLVVVDANDHQPGQYSHTGEDPGAFRLRLPPAAVHELQQHHQGLQALMVIYSLLETVGSCSSDTGTDR